MKINFSDVQRNVSEIANREEYAIDVLYELMAAYGRSASSITKLRNGIINLAEDKDNTVLQRGVVYLKVINDFKSLPGEIEKLEQNPLTQRYNPRFLIATDLKTFAAKDTKKGNTLEIAWADIDRNADFFYGWTGDEVIDEKTEAVADRRAADKMKELYQELQKVNLDKFKDPTIDFRHHLNVFFTRLLFCFFSEDTKVFSREVENMFTNAIRDFTQTDGSDLDEFFDTLFESLDEEDKSKYTSPYSNFPYVNGKLFDKSFAIKIPKFNAQARHLILSCGALSWAEINPDIFGSMFQSVVDEVYRSKHGMHYTSIPNIMKTIEPLFLDELREEFDTNYDNPKKLQILHERISKIKVFDPACGSGNFLIVAYKELRKLEHAIIERLFGDEYYSQQLRNKIHSRIDLNNYYGIEIDDFACEVAVLSLYLAKHQMNIEFEKQFGQEIKLIPLKDKANIVHGNAARLDWQKVCPNVPKKHNLITQEQIQLIVTEEINKNLLAVEEWEEIYLIGNPPYLGGKLLDVDQKKDTDLVLSSMNRYKNLDYIAIWFVKAAQYSGPLTRFAFVSTNSLFQGTQVPDLWPEIFKLDLEIFFAHKNFKWTNSARQNAGVICSIVGIRKASNQKKYIYQNGLRSEATNINAYLVDGPETIVTKRNEPLSDLPYMYAGNTLYDDGNLILEPDEYIRLTRQFPNIVEITKKLTGSREFINGLHRYCLWIDDDKLNFAESIPDIKTRINKVKNFRKTGGITAQSCLDRPHQFCLRNKANKSLIIIPSVSSERREYIPIGILDSNTIITNLAYVIYDAHTHVFALINSKMHMAWMKLLAGRLKSDYRYSTGVNYNTFPVPLVTKSNREDLEKATRNILFARENHTLCRSV